MIIARPFGSQAGIPGGTKITPPMSEISIVPINAIDNGLLTRLALCLEERFLASCIVRASLPVPKSALNSVRKQLFFGSLAAKIAAANEGRDAIVLGITDFDLYKTSHHFIFGSSSESHRCAVVSMHRLRSEFYGEAPDQNLLFQRLLKEAVHEIGHTMGLKHCYDARCPMYYSSSVFDTDNKFSNFCEICEKRSRANR
jgi:archaemetzincin